MNDQDLALLINTAVLDGSTFDISTLILLNPKGSIRKIDLAAATDFIMGIPGPSLTTPTIQISDEQLRKNVKKVLL